MIPIPTLVEPATSAALCTAPPDPFSAKNVISMQCENRRVMALVAGRDSSQSASTNISGDHVARFLFGG